MKRTSFHQSPVRTPLRSLSLTNQSASVEEKVVAESNVVTKKTSAQKDAVDKKGEVEEKTSIYRLETPHGVQKTLDETGEDEEKASFFRFETPAMSDRNMNVFKRSEFDRWVAPNRREVASYCYKSSSSASHRGSLASLPPAPVSRISVINKSTTENGPKSSVEVVELEKPKTIKSTVIEVGHKTAFFSFFKQIQFQKTHNYYNFRLKSREKRSQNAANYSMTLDIGHWKPRIFWVDTESCWIVICLSSWDQNQRLHLRSKTNMENS